MSPVDWHTLWGKSITTSNYDEFWRFARQGRALPYEFTNIVDIKEKNISMRENIEKKGLKFSGLYNLSGKRAMRNSRTEMGLLTLISTCSSTLRKAYPPGRPGTPTTLGGCSPGEPLLYLDSGGIQPSMGHMTRLLLKPSEYRELSWKAKWNPCSSLLMICTVSLASLPEEETSALSEDLIPAPKVPGQILLLRQEETSLEEILQLLFSLLPSSSVFDHLSSFLLFYKWPSYPGGFHFFLLELYSINGLLLLGGSSALVTAVLGDSDDTIFSPCSFGPNAFLVLSMRASPSLVGPLTQSQSL